MESERERQKDFEDTNHVSSVLSLLNQQRSSSKLCDVILRISGDELYAHSNVLAAASPYFDTLFSGPDLPRSFSQKSPQIIEIHIDGEKDSGYGTAVKRVVDFMYTAHIEIDGDVLPQVMEMANIMQMTNILGFCETFQKEEINLLKQAEEGIPKEVNTEEQFMEDNSSEHEMFEVKKDNSDVSEAVTFQKNLKDKPMVVYVNKTDKKKRGRPRKIRDDLDEVSQEYEKENNAIKTEDEEDVLNDTVDQSTSDASTAVLEKSKKMKRTHIQKSTKAVQKITRSGRVIKPRLIFDGTTTKLALLSKSEIKKELPDELELNRNTVLEEIDQDDVGIDDDIADPSFIVPKVFKEEEEEEEEDDLSYTVKRYACEKCDVVVSKLKDFHEHNREHMHAEKKCSYCGWVCENNDEDEFEKHLKNHIGPKPFFCNFCNVRFKTRAQLFLHLPKHSKAKPFVCSICHAGFKWKHALKSHLITHQNTKDYLCDICGFATAYKMQLKSHRLIHTGETYKCPEEGCKYQATKKTNLKFHILTHTREKPHQCEICGTSFSLVKNMKRHMLLHQSDRPYKCSRCLFTSTRFDKLKEHFYKQHNIGEKPGKKFRWSDYLEREESGFQPINMSGNEEENVLDINEENMETIELEIASEESGNTTTQMLNLTSSTGENIPITITQIGPDISYEIPIHLIVPPDQV